MRKFKKYEFTDEAECDLYITNLEEHTNNIVKLGYAVVIDGVYDEQGNETTPPVLTDGYVADVIWNDNKDKDWKDKRIKIKDTEGRKNYHTFSGWDYSDETT